MPKILFLPIPFLMEYMSNRLKDFAGRSYLRGSKSMSAKSMFVMSCRFSLKLFIFASCLLLPMLDSSAAAQQPAVTLAPVITKVAGYGGLGYNGDGGPAVSALMDQPSKVALDAAGNLYIADQFNQVIRKVDVNGLITTVAGNGTIGYSGDGGLATAAQLDYPSDIVVDATGNLFIADFHNSVIRKVRYERRHFNSCR